MEKRRKKCFCLAQSKECLGYNQLGYPVHIITPVNKEVQNDIASTRDFLKKNKLCFDCAKPGDAFYQCKSRGCGRRNGRHHTSICDETLTTLPPKCHAGTTPPSDKFYGANDF